MVRLYLGVGIVFVSLILIACGGGQEAQPTPTPTAEVQAPTPEPTPTPEAAAPEPTVETLAFIDDGDIWLVNADGNNRRRISDFGSTDREVVSFRWVAKGQEIAYEVSLRLEPGTASPSTFTSVLANADGGVLWERELPQFAGVFWSPDGQLVAILPDKGPARIEDRVGQLVWTGNGGEGSGSWSADGSQFAIVEGDEIVVVSRDGTSVSRLYGGPGFAITKLESRQTCPVSPNDELLLGRPVFAPDGESVLVAVNCSINQGTGGLFNTTIRELSLNGLIDRPVLPPKSGFTSLPTPVFSPDGRRVALLEAAGGVLCPDGASAVVTMDLTLLNPGDGTTSELTPGEIVQLANALAAEDRFPPDIFISGRHQESPALWSPVSDAVVAYFGATECVLDEDEEVGEHRLLAEGVYLLRIDGLADERIADEFSQVASWSPSGDLIAYVSGRDFISYYFGEPESGQIRVFDLVTREVTDLGPGHSPAWRPLPPEALSLPWEGAVTDNLRIRSEPSTASDTVGTLPKGTKVRVYGEAQGEEAEAGSGNRTWYRVIGGYVYSAFVER